MSFVFLQDALNGPLFQALRATGPATAGPPRSMPNVLSIDIALRDESGFSFVLIDRLNYLLYS